MDEGFLFFSSSLIRRRDLSRFPYVRQFIDWISVGENPAVLSGRATGSSCRYTAGALRSSTEALKNSTEDALSLAEAPSC
jgi:hypothetical protein